VVVIGTVMVAVMITEAAETLRLTADAWSNQRPAAVAMLCCRLEVSA
jgi:hypothetical protein